MPFDIPGALGAGYTSKEIVEYLQAHPGEARDFDIQGAQKAGYSPEEIVDHLNPQAGYNFQGVPVLAPLQRGVGHLRQEVANLADDVGAKGVGSYIRGNTTQAPLTAETSGHKLTEDLKAGRLLSALSNVPSAALEQAVPVALGAGASLGTGGSLPATLGAGATIGALTQGDAIARARATNNGRSEPSATDLALGLAGGAGVGAVGTAGLGGLAQKGVAGVIKNTAVHAAADAAQPELAALAGSVGTEQGAQNASPSDIAAAALTGAATRGAMGAPQVARSVTEGVRGLTPEGRRQALVDEYAALSPEKQAQAVNTVAARDMVNGAKDAAVPTGTEPRVTAAARSAGDVLDGQIRDLTASLDKQGVLSEGDRATITEAQKFAAGQQRTLLEPQLEAIRGMGLDEATTATLTDALTQRAMLSDAGVANRGTSVLSRGSAILGRIAGFGAGGATGHPFIGAEVGGTIGNRIGGIVADKLGLTQPALLKAGNKAADMLAAAGVEVPSTPGRMREAIAAQQDAVATQARLMGLEDAHGAAMDQMHAQARVDNRVFDATSKAADKAEAEKFLLDHADASKMNRDFDATRASEHRQMYADALAMDRQRTRDQNFERGQEVADAKAIDAAQTRGLNLNEREGGKVAMMALRRAAAADALDAASQVATGPAAPRDAKGPLSDPTTVAMNRATSKAPPKSPVASLAEPMPGTEGLSKAAMIHGELLPEWQYGLGEALKQELHKTGDAKNINTAQEVQAAVKALQDRGWYGEQFSKALMEHTGRVTRGLYNTIRNEMFMNHGIDMRTLEAQAARPVSSASMPLAAE